MFIAENQNLCVTCTSDQMLRAISNWRWSLRKDRTCSTKAERVALILDYRRYRAILASVPPDTDAYGNTIYRDAAAERYLGITRGEDRYHYDSHPRMCGWKQYDTNQDAWYYGIWVSLDRLMVFSYCEGDRTLTVCPDRDHMRAELDRMAAFHGPPPPAFTVFSTDGTVTKVYDARPEITD